MADNISDQEQSDSPDYQLQIPSPSSRSIDSGSPLSIEILDSSDEQNNGRLLTRKKGVFEYLEEFHEDLKASMVYRNGEWTQVLVCQFCTLEVPSRSGIIKKHLASRCHTGNKIAAQTLLGFQEQQSRENILTTGQNQQLNGIPTSGQNQQPNGIPTSGQNQQPNGIPTSGLNEQPQGIPTTGQRGLFQGQSLIQALQLEPAPCYFNAPSNVHGVMPEQGNTINNTAESRSRANELQRERYTPRLEPISPPLPITIIPNNGNIRGTEAQPPSVVQPQLNERPESTQSDNSTTTTVQENGRVLRPRPTSTATRPYAASTATIPYAASTAKRCQSASTATRSHAISTVKRPRTSSTITQAGGRGSVPMHHIKWNNHNSAMRTMFTQYLSQGQFYDVTLHCEGKTIQCHRIILAAASPYFERVFLEHPEKLPVIFMKDVELWQAEALVKFMYKGETSVENTKLVPLLQAAEALQIKAMTGFLLPGQIQATTRVPAAMAEKNISNDYEPVVTTDPAGRPVHEVSMATSEPVPQVIMNGTARENVIVISPDVTVNQGVPSVSNTLPPKKRYLINPAHSQIITTPPIGSVAVHPFGYGSEKRKGRSVDTLSLSLNSAPNGNSTFYGSGGHFHLPNSDEERRDAAIIKDYMRKRSTGDAIDYSAAGVNENTVNQQQRSATATRTMSMPSSSWSEEVQSPDGGGNNGGSGEQQPASGYWMGNIYHPYPEIVNDLIQRQQQADNTGNNEQQQGPPPAMKRKHTRK